MNFDKYLKIPMFLADDMNIGHNSKMLYARLLLLTYKEGYCYADNTFTYKNLNVARNPYGRKGKNQYSK